MSWGPWAALCGRNIRVTACLGFQRPIIARAVACQHGVSHSVWTAIANGRQMPSQIQ